jgi:tetratricopeptide (TPR) repeat protein
MPEKTIDEINRKVRDMFLKGRDALEQKNYDYAIGLLLSVLSLEPDFLKARQFLRAAQSTRFKQSGNPVVKRALVALKFTPSLLLAMMQIQKNPDKAVAVADKVLCEDPANTLALHVLADAAAQRKQIELSIMALEWLAELHPKHTKLLHRLARAYLAANQPDKARDTYEKILQAHPHDGQAASGLRNATAALSMKESKWDQARSYREVLKDKGEAVTLEQESRVVLGDEMVGNLIRENEAKLAQEPENLAVIRVLGGLYTNIKNFDRALEYFEKALALSGGADPTLETKITEVSAKNFDAHIDALQAQLNASPQATQLATHIADLKSQRMQFLIQRAEYLAARYPNESQYHYDLGVLYYEAERFDEAVRELQMAQRHPQRRIATLNYLGLCYMAKGVLDIARDVLLKADSEYKPVDGLKKEIIYNLALAFEKAGETAKAYEQFKRIYEVDIRFRDVAARIEAGQKRGGV